jgi:hypothetical protein
VSRPFDTEPQLFISNAGSEGFSGSFPSGYYLR